MQNLRSIMYTFNTKLKENVNAFREGNSVRIFLPSF